MFPVIGAGVGLRLYYTKLAKATQTQAQTKPPLRSILKRPLPEGEEQSERPEKVRPAEGGLHGKFTVPWDPLDDHVYDFYIVVKPREGGSDVTMSGAVNVTGSNPPPQRTPNPKPNPKTGIPTMYGTKTPSSGASNTFSFDITPKKDPLRVTSNQGRTHAPTPTRPPRTGKKNPPEAPSTQRKPPQRKNEKSTATPATPRVTRSTSGLAFSISNDDDEVGWSE